jgi:hypothetical protein
MPQYFSITQSSITALVTVVIGQVVAFVPSLSGQEQALISLGSTVVAVAFLIANAIHAHAAAKITAAIVTKPMPPAPAVKAVKAA